ncbi:MAG: protein translocase subunit SecD [Nitrospinota bacterium]
MAKGLRWKVGLILLVVLGAIYYAYPVSETIRLGLDLQGGIHLVLEVEAEKAVEGSLDRWSVELRDRFRRKGIRTLDFRREDRRLLIQLERPEDEARLDKVLRDYPFLQRTGMEGSPPLLTYRVLKAEARRIERNAVDQALETIRNRIDQFGVAEPTLQRQGERRLIIQLPGLKDPERAKALIGKTALLEFKLVDEDGDLEKALKGEVPRGDVILYEVVKDRETGQVTRKTPYLLKKQTALTGHSLTDARVEIGDRFSEPYVSISFDSTGARVFDRITAANVGRRLAIVLDGVVYSAPVIQERISGGRAQITGRFTLEEARDLAIALRAGALPAPVKVLEERNVGPSLGRDSVRMGVISIIVGGILVLAFMVFYYKVSGLIADFVLILNLIILLGALGGLGATLTLPGIAGIILTVGMAVDANVLIFERIREELRLGKTVRGAVESGYGKAFLTIMDAQITTLIAAIVLFQFGTGPVKGFAVTLSIGILSSLFTAIFVSRTIFDIWLSRRQVRALSI